VNQTDLLVKLGSQNPCKALTMNNLQNKQLYPGQTVVNLVNMVKISQSASCFGRFGVAGFANFSLQPLAFSLFWWTSSRGRANDFQ